MSKELTHIDETGKAKMVDITDKADTHRIAVAQAKVLMKPGTIELIKSKKITKGDVFTVAKIAGILAAKHTSELIPMCHPLMLTNVELTIDIASDSNAIILESTTTTIGKTGVEMEALVSVSTAALTIYDMCKSVDPEMIISDIKLIRKSGGKSGEYIRH